MIAAMFDLLPARQVAHAIDPTAENFPLAHGRHVS